MNERGRFLRGGIQETYALMAESVAIFFLRIATSSEDAMILDLQDEESERIR